MKIVMIGEAASHHAELSVALDRPAQIVHLPVAAADNPAWDEQIEGADVLVAMRFQRPPGRAPRVDLLHVPGAGLDRIAFDALQPGTVVCNAFEHEIPIAEFVTLAMLQHEIRLGALQTAFGEGWSAAYRARVPHGELHGKTQAIVGFGRIGQCIASRARAFGMNVIALDKHSAPGAPALPADRRMPLSQFDELVAAADYLVLACPLNGSTRGMIGVDALARMKPDAVLINVSRAQIVDEDALYDALANGRIGGAVLDVWYGYPIGADDDVAPSRHRFDKLPNAVCTPHSAAWTDRLFARRYAAIAHNINRLAGGIPLHNVVHGDAAVLAARRAPAEVAA